MRCCYSRRGVGEIVSAVFAIIAIVALIVVLVYLFNLFNYALASSRNIEAELYVITHSTISVMNVTCSGHYCSAVLGLSPEAVPYVRDVACVGEGTSSGLISCRAHVTDIDRVVVTYRKDEFGKYDYVLFSIILNRGFVMYVSMNNRPIDVSAIATPYRMHHITLIVSFYNNATAWTCINATLQLEIECNGESTVVPVLKIGETCLQPLSSIVNTTVVKLSHGMHGCWMYLVGKYTVNLVKTYNIKVKVGYLYR